MKVQVIAVEKLKGQGKKGPYDYLEVTHKVNGKIGAKKLFPFSYPEVTNVFKNAESGSWFDVEVVKNDQGFNDWVKVQPTAAEETSAPVDQPKVSGTPYKGRENTYETPAERAHKQMLITRQACLNTAVATLKVDKSALSPDDVIPVAAVYEAWVNRKPDAVQALIDMEDDIPV